MTTEGSSEAPSRSALRLELGVIAAIVYVISALLLGWPALMFGLGLDALGSDSGWWSGDSNLNDDDQNIGIPIGIVSLAAIALAAAIIVVAVARRYRLSAIVPIATGTSLLVIMLVVVGVLTVSA